MYVEAHAELRDHPKTLRAARLLGVPKVAVIGHLLCLWWWAQAYAPADGDLSGFDADDLADAAEWPGDPAAFVAALVACGRGGAGGFLDNSGGGLRINDWSDYGGKVHVKRAQGAERQRRFRSAHGAAPGNAAVTAGDSAGNAHVTHSNALRNGDVTRLDVDIDQHCDPGVDLSSGVAADLKSSGADAPGAVGASVPLSLQFREITDALRAEGANRPAILRGWYIACFGDSGDVPDFSRFGQVAKLVGGAGRLAERIMELSARPPTGDVLAYIQAETRNSKAERRPARAAGGPAATADWEIAARAVGADGALDAGADVQPVRAPAGPVVAGDPDLVAVLADMGIDGIAGVWRAGETPEGVPVVRVEYAGDHAWFGRKGVVALRKRIAPVIGAAPVFDVQGVAA